MQPFHLHARRRRAKGALLVLFLGLGGLALAFFNAQVVKTASYSVQSDANRLRPISVPAPRGTIFDRNGKIIADNIPGYTLLVLPTSRDSLRATLDKLSPIVRLTEEGVDAILERHGEFPNQPVVVSSDLSFDQVSAVEERRSFFPGVFIETRPKRRYPGGEAVAHLVGYVAEISREDLERPEFSGYEPGQIVGKAGLERQYERVLGGEPGIRYVEVDALGRILGDYMPRPQVEPVPGKDVHLYLDLDLQKWVARIFPDTMRGAIVALEPGTGHVLALYSQPTFDPNEFVGGIEPERWRALSADTTNPLLNRATRGLYPPGSTFKLATAAMALDLGVVDPREYMPIPCRGGMQYGNRYFRCWEPAGHGYLDLPDAIKHSCNVYFYQLGVKIGLERFLSEATRLGFTKETGIDLPTENAGRFPTGPAWYRERFGWNPTPSEVLNLAIGQGANDQTPLKMAQFFAALAGDGTVAAPRLAAVGPPAQSNALELRISPDHLEQLREGLRRVTAPGGTAHLASLEHWDLIGKTGTSQNPHGKNHAWFVGMAGPKDGDPEVVVAAILEFGDHGYVAAQYAAKTADYYLRRKHGMPIDTIQTLRDHIVAGKPTPWAEWR